MKAFPASLRSLVTIPEPELKKKLLELSHNFVLMRTVPKSYFHLPTKAAPETDAILNSDNWGSMGLRVRVRVLVSATGQGIQADSDAKDPAIKKVSEDDVMKLPFPRVEWDLKPVPTVRTVAIVYHSRQSLEAVYGYGPDPFTEVASGLVGKSPARVK